uniref:Golgin subfamily A member 4 n=1 Tax=Zeugodacus cucurbitae TaxID=28588 RepID=A0A0A1WI14_ZEUCU
MSTKFIKEFDATQFLKLYKHTNSELQARQRQYRKDLEARLPNVRIKTMQLESYKHGCKKMKTEKDVLKAKIWTASGKCHDDKNDQALSSIKCFIECNETLSEEIQKLKLYINNLDRKLNVINKEICQMNMIQFQKSRKDLEHAKRSLHLLEDQYENQIQMECKLTALSEKLRLNICELINDRRLYYSFYTKYIQKLTSENKYLTDLIDFALDQIQIGIDMFEKLDAQGKNFMYDLDKRKLEMETLQRIKTANDTMWEFHEKKFVKRKLTEIPMKEIVRREICRDKYIKKLNLYNKILKKILNYTKASDIEHVIDKFQEQESLYYSFSNHSNEISYRITLLNNSVARLFGELQELKIGNRNALRSQNGMIEKLENMLKVKRLNNINLKRKANVQNERIKKLFEGLQLIRDQTRVDISMLAVDFVDHKEINIKDIREQMKLIENRVQSLVCAIYKMERQKNRGIFKIYLVRDLYKVIDGPTELDQVVPATQCAECAEGDARNVDDAWNVNIMPIKDVKIWVSEKVGQPELQYRLHNVNQCRLTRSRSRRQY